MGRKKKPMGEGAVRMTISLHPELKKEIDSPPGGVSVNWSAVAAEAFRRKLRELRTSAEGVNMTDVIERMRVLDQANGEEQYQAGVKAGQEWVMGGQVPNPKRLRRLAREVGSFRSVAEYVEVTANTDLGNPGTAMGIYADLGGPGRDRRGCQEFWKDEVGLGKEWEELADDVMFANGFVERVLDMWDEIEKKL